MNDLDKLREIERIARLYSTPASNIGAHVLARRIIGVIEEKSYTPPAGYEPPTQDAYTAQDRR